MKPMRRHFLAILALAALGLARHAQSAAAGKDDKKPAIPLLTGTYDASAKRPLARRGEQTLNEEDLLFYSMASGDSNPAIFHEYETAPEGERKEALRAELRARIERCFYAAAMAEQDAAQTELSEVDRKRLRLMEHPIYAFVWIDLALAASPQASEAAERLYYRNHPEEFVTPRRAVVRYIFRRLAPGMSEEERFQQELLMDELHRYLSANPSEFEQAARRVSEAPSAANGGLVEPFEAGTYFAEFEQEAFRLVPGEVSHLIRGPQGLYLIQLVEIQLPRPIPIEEARKQLSESIAVQQTVARFQYEVTKLREQAKIEERFWYWDKLGEPEMALRIDGRIYTKGDLWRLNPDIIDAKGQLNRGVLDPWALRLVEYELIRAEVERRHYDLDPRIARGHDLALTLLRAELAERRYLEEHLRFSQSESTAFRDETIAASERAPVRRAFYVWGQIENPRQLDATTLANLRESLPRELQRYIENAESAPFAPLAETAETSALAPAAVRGVSALKAPNLRFSWRDLGEIGRDSLPELALRVRDVPPGRF